MIGDAPHKETHPTSPFSSHKKNVPSRVMTQKITWPNGSQIVFDEANVLDDHMIKSVLKASPFQRYLRPDTNIPWWVRLALLFKRAGISWDSERKQTGIVYKLLWGKLYIVDEIGDRTLEDRPISIHYGRP